MVTPFDPYFLPTVLIIILVLIVFLFYLLKRAGDDR